MNFKGIEEIANNQGDEKKRLARVQALTAATRQKAILLNKIAAIDSDIEKAKDGNWLTLVEKYVSHQAAEEFE